MKNYKLLLGLAAGLFFAGCSTDDIGNDSPIVEKDEIRYLNVAICAPGAGTRADVGFTQGGEHEIKSLKFFFYDIDGKPTGVSTPVNADNWGPVNATNPTETVEWQATEAVQVYLKKGDKLPAYVVCLVNSAGNDDSQYETKTMDELRSETTELIVDVDNATSKSYFKMNNSVYFGTDPIKGQTNVRMFGSPIDATTQLLPTQGAAKAADPIKIYVERFAARVTVKQDATDFEQTNYQVDGYELEFKPIAWAVNADAPTTYLSKRFVTEANAPAADYNTVNTNLKGWQWNDADNFRSYWACSPSYYADDFPIVSDDISDNSDEGTGANEKSAGYDHIYYSYKYITTIPTTPKASDKNAQYSTAANGTTLYAKENTAGLKAFGSDNPKAAVPSIVLAGWYKVKGTGANAGTNLDDKTTFYLYGKTTDGKSILYSSENKLKEKFIGVQTILATDAQGTYLRATTRAAVKVMHPSKATRVAANIKVPTRYVTLQVDPDADLSGLFIMDEANNTWKQMTTADAAKINSRLIQTVGYAAMYEEGACYYSIPIKHLRYSTPTEGETTAPNNGFEPNSKEFDWSIVRPGDFGLVRNHSYTINIKKISGLATGVSDKNMPIVPPMDEDEYWIGYEINILKWAVVPTQDVNL